MTRPARLEDRVVEAWTVAHPHWAIEDSHLVRYVKTTDYPSGARLLQAQVVLAEGLDHHPDVTFSYRRLRFELWTHDRDGLTQLDLDYAEGLDSIIENDFAGFVH
ncbi:MAG TPA: 4a-hydroxytetrahydrobiopterin dehydratase [Acidimicrobiales bacterium]